MRTIKELLDNFLTQDRYYSSPSSGVKADELALLIGAYNDTEDNFILFENGGGRPFHIWKMEDGKGKEFVEYLGSYAYAYKLNGKTTIVKPIQ